jgi:hypothetical protein
MKERDVRKTLPQRGNNLKMCVKGIGWEVVNWTLPVLDSDK